MESRSLSTQIKQHLPIARFVLCFFIFIFFFLTSLLLFAAALSRAFLCCQLPIIINHCHSLSSTSIRYMEKKVICD